MNSLEAFLDQAASALIAGDFDALSRLTPHIESFDLADVDRRTAQILTEKSQRNARLLDAAARGIKAASQRYSEVVRGPTLTTYDSRGQISHLSSAPETRTRRV